MATLTTTSARPSRQRSLKDRRVRTQGDAGAAGPPLNRPAFRQQFVNHIRTIRDALHVVMTCTDALRYQAADNDREIATVLRLYGGNKLYEAIRQAGVLLALLDGKTDIDPEGDEIAGLADPVDRPF